MCFQKENISSANYNFVKTRINHSKKSHLNSKKNHTCRWYDDTQPYKIFCPNLTPSVRYKKNKFQVRKLSKWFVRNLLFLYLINEVEFGQNILQGCVSSYHLHVWFFCNLDDFFIVICTSFHEIMVCTRYVLLRNSSTKRAFVNP